MKANKPTRSNDGHKDDLDRFRKRRGLWLACLTGDDRHSISHQIHSMIWYAGAFRVVNEARRLAPPAPEGGVELNGLVHDLIDHGFFVSQAAAVRRLLDGYPLDDPKRGVYSLVALLQDMRKHAALISRRHIFSVEGLVYDYAPLKQEYDRYLKQQLEAGEQAFHVPQRLNWEWHEHRHQHIDRLAGVTADRRSEGDSVQPIVFDRLVDRLQAAGRLLQQQVDKYIAHAATPESRALVNADDSAVTLNHLWNAHRTIAEVANFVSVYLLGGSNLGYLPIPQFDHLKYIDRPLVSHENTKKLSAVWDEFDKETHAWALWGLDQALTDQPPSDP